MERTFSSEYPKIQKSHGKILFPHDIQKETVADEAGTRTQYSFVPVWIEDKNRRIGNYEDFKARNYAEIRRGLYGTWQEQMDALYHGTWEKEIAAVKEAVPKPTVKAVL